MARGLTANWKQPFGFVFSSVTVKDVLLKQLIPIAITELEQIAVICDQGSNNLAVTKSFMHNGTQYFVIYDPPHLIKSIQNYLHKSGLKCEAFEVYGNIWKPFMIMTANCQLEWHVNLQTHEAATICCLTCEAGYPGDESQ
ncbi:hypothetical protein PoB_000063200 [Plakobranchus ocellatus]|uniref:Transposable element P transposase-like RNase H domain-containing protein n=1 Tax=Plakobranchus ocellatus TaxID=259542 RepID=A0AAV3XVI8_9GAST|nr:hypothetical protein PoB_000063200 [Plakobranchus ocellatus]